MNINIWLTLLGILGVIIGLIARIKSRHPIAPAPTERPNPFDGNTPLPYAHRPIMTQTELQVYDKLLQALPDYMVFAQVQVSRVVESPPEDNLYWFNFINRLSYDFVVCRTDGTPIAAIEIDDDTHNIPERQETDTRKDLATQAAGISMLRWEVRDIPTKNQIRQSIEQIDAQFDHNVV
ncbi:DUF2726 domain-containing protein [Alysiella filiformis]|uniref:DUF2726 domain-containing protein n=1 Tax=Alysiella filiformis DSM 16848 TaxID=1120981 RepID=A0A286E3F0_9NEIS|nr:DUF2726 domain-containing protein [Alysiella filiformis]QMT31093.1 DUF2726 domain-containing protein [Alysiella filiformis]UBQ55915.1 DUF2726 domain-containing protein [Alysiella filiformis DSM 16848]SOD65430.1 Protein of unknown function [Alysiella filiformis DSM 16848]